MEHVIDVEDGDAAVLRESGSGGLIGRGLLADRPLTEYVEPAETPRYVVRNKKRGVSIERTDGGAADADSGEKAAVGERAGSAEGELVPDGDHSAAALVTDVRVLFAVGRADGDRTRSVALSDVVDARTEDGFLGGALVLDTVDDLQYRFPTRGDLGAVREFVDAAAGTWARAERHLDAAADALDRADAQLGSGDADDVLEALDDARETLTAAREEASSLDGAAASLSDRAESLRERLRRIERRAYAERAEQTAERARARREDDYEAAMDLLERADESYVAALSVDADRPADDVLERRRDRLATERDRLSTVPLERAEAAVDEASSADDPAAAAERWERALDRYETLRTLDWGRDDRRFAGERDAVHDQLATVAERLAAAHCERARRAIDLIDDAPPEAADAAAERAASALDAARDVARERLPNELDTVERLRDRLAERRAARADESVVEEEDADAPGDLFARETVVVTPEDDEGSDADDGAAVDDGAPTDDNEAPTDEDSPTGGDENAPPGGDEEAPTDVDREIANALAEAMADETQDSIAEAVDETMGNVGADEPDADVRERDSDGDGWVFVDDETDDERVSAERVEMASSESEGSGAEAGESVGDSCGSGTEAEADVADSETRIERSGVETSAAAEVERPTGRLSSLGPERFRTLVAELFETTGWETESRRESLGAADLRATTPAPVTVTAAVLTVDAASAAAVDPDDVDRFAAAAERADDRDEAVLAVGARLPERTRERAADRNVRVLGPDALADVIDDHDVSCPGDGAAEF